MKAPKTQKSRNVAPGANDYKTIPQSSHLVKENQIPEGVSVVSDNDFYGNHCDTFNYAEFAHSKRKLSLHEKKVKSSFVKNDEVHKWIQQSVKNASIHCRITIK